MSSAVIARTGNEYNMSHSESMRARAHAAQDRAGRKPQEIQAIGGGSGGIGALDANTARISDATARIGSTHSGIECTVAMNAAQQAVHAAVPSCVPESGQHGILPRSCCCVPCGCASVPAADALNPPWASKDKASRIFSAVRSIVAPVYAATDRKN